MSTGTDHRAESSPPSSPPAGSSGARLDADPSAGVAVDPPAWACARSPLGTFPECPMCGGAMAPEHAHERCTSCGWRDSCCD